jgi:hypothetical protein
VVLVYLDARDFVKGGRRLKEISVGSRFFNRDYMDKCLACRFTGGIFFGKLSCDPYHVYVEREIPSLIIGTYNFTHFSHHLYWHDRLVLLKGAFDESKPDNVSQLWNDRRDRTQWYTHWFVIRFTLFLGADTKHEGCHSSLQAYHSWVEADYGKCMNGNM